MTPEDREFVDTARSVADRLAQMSAVLAKQAARNPVPVNADTIAAGVLSALGNLTDAICDELEARA